MKVEVEISSQDFEALIRAMHRRARTLPFPHPGRMRLRLAEGAVWLAIVLFGIVILHFSRGSIRDYLPFGLFLVVAVSGAIGFNRWIAQRSVYPDGSGIMLGRKSYELTETGLVEVSLHGNYMTRWSGVVAVEETPDHLFLFFDRCAGSVIPKRCFASVQEAADFSAFAKDHAGATIQTDVTTAIPPCKPKGPA